MAIPSLAINTGNMYLDVIHRVHEQLRLLTVAGADRDLELSDTPLVNLELAPVAIDNAGAVTSTLGQQIIAPSAHISVDSTETISDIPDANLSDIVELMNVRIELYIGRDNDNYRLTTKTADLMDDFRQVLSPLAFLGASISDSTQLNAAGILQMGFDERLRGSDQEILVCIFQVRLDHGAEI